jgi:hypothetical protein
MTITNYAAKDGHVFVTKCWSPNVANATSNDETTGDELTSEHAEEPAIEPDPAEGYDGRCGFCGSLNIECLVSGYGPEGKLLDLDALIDAASRCKTCERIYNLRGLRDFTGAQFNNSVRVRFKTRPRIDGCCGSLVIEAADCSCPGITYVTFIAKYTIFTDEGDIASLKHSLLPLQTVGNNTSSAESFNIARKWLNNCIEGHEHNLRATSFRKRFGQSKLETGVGPA